LIRISAYFNNVIVNISIQVLLLDSKVQFCKRIFNIGIGELRKSYVDLNTISNDPLIFLNPIAAANIMEKAKAYIKNELRGGSQQSEPATTPTPTSPASLPGTLPGTKQPYPPVELMPSPGAAAHRSSRTPGEPYHLGYQPHPAQHYYPGVKSTGRASAPPDNHHVPMTICFVCGGHGGYEPQPLRIRHNPERPAESYFPFLERHEPPNGVAGVSPGQEYVWACMLCFRSLNEQWDAYERQKKPLLQRIYHMKRVDGKGYIGADVATQSEYAANL